MRIRLQFCSALKQVSFRMKWSSLPGSMGTTSISPDDGSLWSAGISERGDLSNKNRKLWRVLALKDEFNSMGTCWYSNGGNLSRRKREGEILGRMFWLMCRKARVTKRVKTGW